MTETGETELETAEQQPGLIGRVAVVGYPNVGKSTLVNRLSGTRSAIVHETPGVTRDRKEIECEWNGECFLLIDTGGVDAGDPRPMAKQIVQQARRAIADADLVMLVVDAAAGVSAADLELAEIIRTSRVPVVVVANKLDNPRREDEGTLEFYQLGLGEPVAASALHGHNIGDLLDLLVDRLREHGSAFRREVADATIKVAVLGRPNVGKSTLVNALLGSDRVIVSDVAGTTRDSIDTPLTYEDRSLLLIDTAGIRRRRSGRDAIEFYGEVRSLQAAERADIALVLIDASDGVREADLSIADQARQRHCATLVVLSKWDVNEIDLEDVRETIREKLRQRPELITTSGVTGRNVVRLPQKIVELYERYSQRVQTAELNDALTQIKADTPPPGNKKGKRLNLLYGTQYQTAPPRFRIVVNDRSLVTRNYGYYVENRLRERFGFEGCPLIIDFQDRS